MYVLAYVEALISLGSQLLFDILFVKICHLVTEIFTDLSTEGKSCENHCGLSLI